MKYIWLPIYIIYILENYIYIYLIICLFNILINYYDLKSCNFHLYFNNQLFPLYFDNLLGRLLMLEIYF